MKQEKWITGEADDSSHENPRDLILSGTTQLGLTLSAVQIDQFLIYLTELQRWNRKTNLTAISEGREIVIKHFLDSLSPLTALNPKQDSNWMDAGTGAGFPGLVLKIVLPQIKMTLVEPSQKKSAFLHHLIGLFGMRYVSVINARIEDVVGTEKEPHYDLLMTRALSREIILDKADTFVRSGGKVLLFQRASQIADLKNTLKNYPYLELYKVVAVRLPFDRTARSLVLLRVKKASRFADDAIH